MPDLITRMPAAPNSWRADGGYQSVDPPVTMYPMFFSPVVYGPPFVVPGPPPPPYPTTHPGPAPSVPPPPAHLSPQPHSAPAPSEGLGQPGSGLPQGFKYIYPTGNTTIHLAKGGVEPWKQPGTVFQFDGIKIGTNATVRELIAACGGDESNAITEMVELGSGRWAKGRTFKHEDAKAEWSLERLGWSAKKGVEHPPVWITMTKS